MFREGRRASELGPTAHLDGVAELVSIALVLTCGAPMYSAVRALRPDVAMMRSGVPGKRFGNKSGIRRCSHLIRSVGESVRSS